jgi:short-subunit dehydrogenase
MDRTVIVTGASTGIGAITARRFWQEGAKVVLVARTESNLVAVARQMDPTSTLVLPLDISEPEAAAYILEKAQARFGHIHIVVNSVVSHPQGLFEKNDLGDLAAMVDVNLRAPLLLCRLALPYLRRSGKGTIVNVGSMAGRIPVPGAATYSATKAALRTFSLALAQELKNRGITVSIVSPGPVLTDRVRRELDRIPDLVFCIPVPTPEQVADAILACAHDDKPERAIPPIGGFLTSAGEALPWARNLCLPLAWRLGRWRKGQIRKMVQSGLR